MMELTRANIQCVYCTGLDVLMSQGDDCWICGHTVMARPLYQRIVRSINIWRPQVYKKRVKTLLVICMRLGILPSDDSLGRIIAIYSNMSTCTRYSIVDSDIQHAST